MGADVVLEVPHIKFNVIKKFFPHALHRYDKWGNLICYQKIGRLSLPNLRAHGVTKDMMEWHFVYCQEWMMKCARIQEGGEAKKVFSVIDLGGLNVSQFDRDARAITLMAVKLAATHYPDQMFRLAIINVPRWFSLIWSLVNPLLNDAIRAKVVPCRPEDSAKIMSRYVHLHDLPIEYGGTCPVPIGSGAFEACLYRHTLDNVARANKVLEKADPDVHGYGFIPPAEKVDAPETGSLAHRILVVQTPFGMQDHLGQEGGAALAAAEGNGGGTRSERGWWGGGGGEPRRGKETVRSA